MSLIHNQINVSAILQSIFLSQSRFFRRFIKKSRLEDPFGRAFDICEDIQNNMSRVAIKDYSASTIQQREDVLMNLQSYRSLQQIQGICKLISFCHLESTGDIVAAFQYNDSTLQELITAQFFEDNRNQFYLFILKQLLFVFQNAKSIGIELDDLNTCNILLYRVENHFRMKILFDQRQKRYDKILQGVKAYCSIQSIQAALGIRESQPQQNKEFIFELGLVLLDVICTYQAKCKRSSSVIKGSFDQSKRGFYVFENSTPLLNLGLIDEKKNFITSLNQPLLNSLIGLITKMICPKVQRINVQDIIQKSKQLLQKQGNYKNMENISTPKKQLSSIKQTNSPSPLDSLKYSQQASSYFPNTKNMATQTTLTKNVFMDQPQIQSKDSKANNFSQSSISYHLIPKNKILSQVNVHKDIKQQLNKFITALQSRITVNKKQYLDCSIYYGELDSNNHKRQGLGMYFYTHGDIYFGKWKDNVLIDGTYIFRNGQCFEGQVKNGKQGWGRYYYSNGNIYEGDWKDDLKSGRGKMVYQNGDIYQGSWVKGKRNGEGIYYYHNGSIYKGSFSHGKKSGFGLIIFPNQTRVQAFWVDNHIEGKGKIYYNNGHYYDGQFYFSEKQGNGLYRWEDETKYQGQFKKDSMLGEGKIRYLDNEYYEGRIENGKRQGFGIYKYPNGDEFKGEWKNDQKLVGQYKFHDGRLFDGKFKKNQMNYGVMIYENGDSYQGQFSNGQRHGQGLYRNSGRQLVFDGKWANDKFISTL